MSTNLRFTKIVFLEIVWYFSELFGVNWWVQSQNNLFWGSWSLPLGSKAMRIKGFRVFPKCKRKVHNNSSELLGSLYDPKMGW